MIKKSVLLVSNFKPDNQISMQRYSELLGVGLKQNGVRVRIWHPKAIFSNYCTVGGGLFKWLGYLDKFIIGGLVLFFRQFFFSQVHICDHSNAMYRFLLWGRRVTVTCHDVIAIEAARGSSYGWKTGKTGKIFQKMIFSGLKRCDKILCVSQYTRAQLLALGGVDVEILQVVYNPIDPRLIMASQDCVSSVWRDVKELLGKNYVMHIGSDHQRKNRIGLINIFINLVKIFEFKDCNLLIIGPNLSSNQFKLIEEAGLANRVFIRSFPEEADLAAAYRGAKCLIFPSYLEGFGWPIAEAQALGCPVFTTAAEPMIEVGGDAAVYIDPDNAKKSADIISNADLDYMRSAGYNCGVRFSIDKLVSAILIK